MKPVIFLDRDGTLIEDTGYLRDPNEVQLIPHAADALKVFRRKGYRLFVVSNQSGVGRGIITQTRFQAVHDRFIQLLAERGIHLDGFGYCFHHPDESCSCRKPRTGLIPNRIGDFAVDLSRSFVIGDRLGDLELGKAIGAHSYLVLTGVGCETQKQLPIRHSWLCVANLLVAANSISAIGYN